MERDSLKKFYGMLKGMKEVVFTQDYVRKEFGDDFNSVIKEVSKIIDDDLNSFYLSGKYYYESDGGDFMCTTDLIKEKLLQFISLLEYGYNINEHIVEVGSIYNSIIDEELKGRCSDILTAIGNFDRVINQATLVLEDRIRTKSQLDRSFIGVTLVNKALNPDLTKTILVISDEPNEHEGLCHICRGIMLAFRNPTHHIIIDDYSREDALKICAFIDSILQLINKSKVK